MTKRISDKKLRQLIDASWRFADTPEGRAARERLQAKVFTRLGIKRWSDLAGRSSNEE